MAVQTLRPIGDFGLDAGHFWPAGGWAAIDEVTPDDGDYMAGDPTVVGDRSVNLALSPAIGPITGRTEIAIVRIRLATDVAGVETMPAISFNGHTGSGAEGSPQGFFVGTFGTVGVEIANDGLFHTYEAAVTPAGPGEDDSVDWTLTENVFNLDASGDMEPTQFLRVSWLEIGLDTSAEGLDPDNGPVAGGTTVTLTWSDLAPGATVTIDDVAVAFDDVAHTFVTPAHVPGQVDVVVTNPDTSTITFAFTYYHPPIVTPRNGPIEGGTAITIRRVDTGDDPDSAFVDGATVTFGGSVLPATRVHADLYTVTTDPHATGLVDVGLTNLDARALVMTLPDAFYFGAPTDAPVVTLSPEQIAQPPIPSTVTLQATVTGGTLSAQLWTQSGGPEHVTIGAPTSLVTTVTFDVYTPGTYTFTFTASEASGAHPPIIRTTTVVVPAQTPPRLTLP